MAGSLGGSDASRLPPAKQATCLCARACSNDRQSCKAGRNELSVCEVWPLCPLLVQQKNTSSLQPGMNCPSIGKTKIWSSKQQEHESSFKHYPAWYLDAKAGSETFTALAWEPGTVALPLTTITWAQAKCPTAGGGAFIPSGPAGGRGKEKTLLLPSDSSSGFPVWRKACGSC